MSSRQFHSLSISAALIVHVDGKEAESLADEIEAFLIEYDTNTQREYHSETDIRVFAPID